MTISGCSATSQAEATAGAASSSAAEASPSVQIAATGRLEAVSYASTTSYASDSRSSSSDRGDSPLDSADTVSASVVPGSQARPEVALTDGTYYATGQGKAGDVPVTVVIEGGLITRITLGENDEAPAMAEKAQATVVPEIIAEQTADVDTATGATTTSQAIIDAVSQVIERAQR